MSLGFAVVLLYGACYLIGAIPFGYLAGLLKGVDIRTQGSRNIGATNAGRVLGRPWGIAVFALDVAKGLGPVILGGMILADHAAGWGMAAGPRNLIWLGCGANCILGHTLPVYLRFRGGKGVATSLGVILGFFPHLTIAGVLAFLVWAIVTGVTRYVSVGSICAALALPVLVVCSALRRGGSALREDWPFVVFAVVASGLVVFRHRGNIARLRAGTEHKIGRSPAQG
jgi:acyl phosphate:glycerol-3-phosphate acyltransferase